MTKIGVIKNGLRSLYKTSKGKIDTKSLGWIRPDGKINFQSEETALNYAKNRALQGLNAPIPYENQSLREQNPFGFLVINYSTSYVGTPEDPESYLRTAKDVRFGQYVY